MKLAVGLTALLLAAPAAAQRGPRELATEIHTRGGYSDSVRFESGRGELSSFPSLGGPTGADAPRGARLGGGEGLLEARRISEGASGRAEDSGFAGLFGAASTVISKVLLVVVIVALVILVGFVVVALRRRRLAPPDDTTVARPRRRAPPAPEELPLDLGDPEALAAEGRYDEAILSLLVLALKAVGWRPEGQRSRTAREVLWSIATTDPRHAPLSLVVRRAERVRFGGDEANAGTFDEVREGYRALRRASGGASVRRESERFGGDEANVESFEEVRDGSRALHRASGDQA